MDREIKNPYKKFRRPAIIASAAVAVMAIAFWVWTAVKSTSYQTDRSDLTFGDVTAATFDDYIRLNGRVETAVVVQVSALETGLVEQKLMEEGAMVSPGDVILTLRNPNLQQQILDSEAQLAEKQNMLRDTEIAMEKERLQIKQDLLTTRTELNRKQRKYHQQEALLNENLTSREAYLNAKEDYELALESLQLLLDRQRQDSLYRTVQVGMMRESLANMHSNLMLVRQRADNLSIRATHSGQLGNLTAEIGQNIPAGQQVGQINILDSYKISALVDEHYIDRVQPGLTGDIERQNHLIGVEVKKVYPEVEQGQFRIDLTFNGVKPEKIRVGQTFHVNLRLGEPTEAVTVPRGLFFRSTGGKWVYVVAPDGKTATRRLITIGRQNPLYYEVTDGLTPGEKIITSSYEQFGDADRIIIRN